MARCECGVFGVFGHPEAAELTSRGLYALQHRGHESAGIASVDRENLKVHRAMGRVRHIFGPEQLAQLRGQMAIGHTRYSTAGSSVLANAQPLDINGRFGPVALVHNGNLVNAYQVRPRLVASGARFTSTGDSEVILHLIDRSPAERFDQAVVEALSQVEGAYSLLLLSREGIYAIRDPAGVRPLELGRLDGAWVIASETEALRFVGASHDRSLEPGEMVGFFPDKITSAYLPGKVEDQFCLFELVYLGHMNSLMRGRSVYDWRKELGRALAKEARAIEADIVVAVPNSGIGAALGFHEASGLPFEEGLLRSTYSDAGRTFIEPDEKARAEGVRFKLTPVEAALEGKRVVLVDDSIIRGTTIREIVRMVREAGAREVHVAISCPPTKFPCFYGIDMQRSDELIAARLSVEAIRDSIGADSLTYLSLEAFRKIVGPGCTACWSGEYRLPTPSNLGEYLQTVREDPPALT